MTCKFWWRYFSLSASSRHLHDILITVIIVDTITTEWHLHTVTSLLWFTVCPEQHLRPTCLTELVSGFLQVSEPGWFNEGGERGRQQVTGSSALHLSSRSELWRAASRCERVNHQTWEQRVKMSPCPWRLTLWHHRRLVADWATICPHGGGPLIHPGTLELRDVHWRPSSLDEQNWDSSTIQGQGWRISDKSADLYEDMIDRIEDAAFFMNCRETEPLSPQPSRSE